MAWIEAATHSVVNLDNIECLDVDINSDCERITLYANGESGHPIHTEEISDLEAQEKRFDKLMVEIAQIARGNAYISQKDVQRMAK